MALEYGPRCSPSACSLVLWTLLSYTVLGYHRSASVSLRVSLGNGSRDTSNAKSWKGSSGTDLASMQDTSAVGNGFWHMYLKGIHQQFGDSGTDLLQEKAWSS